MFIFCWKFFFILQKYKSCFYFIFFIPLCHAQRHINIYIYIIQCQYTFASTKTISTEVISNTIAFAFREFDDNTSLDGSLENMERGSIASFGSGNTTDSEHPREKVTTKFSFTKGSIMYILPKTYGYITNEFGMETETFSTFSILNCLVTSYRSLL